MFGAFGWWEQASAGRVWPWWSRPAETRVEGAGALGSGLEKAAELGEPQGLLRAGGLRADGGGLTSGV